MASTPPEQSESDQQSGSLDPKKLSVESEEQELSFQRRISWVELWVSKVLSVAMVVVILLAVVDLVRVLILEIVKPPLGLSTLKLVELFGLFLNVLVALEILENITAYFKKHAIQVELVVITSLIAVSRKIIVLDLKQSSALDVIGLGVAVLSLSISYWIVRAATRSRRDDT